MSRKTFGAAAGAAIITIGILTGSATSAAADDYTVDDLSAQQRQAIASWDTTATNVSRDTPKKASVSRAASTSGVKTIRLYRGSWLMWGQESVEFGYSSNGTTVTYSSGYQDSGWIIPNNVTEGGTSRYYKTSTLHQWRGKYTVGAGVPTPWGNANVYSATSWAQSNIKNIGSVQYWLN